MHDDISRLSGRFDPHRLPEFAPDRGLWPRVLAAHQRQVRWRRWQRGAGLAAASVVAGLALWTVQPPPQPGSLAFQRESQVLEREWQNLAAQRRAPAAELARVRVIDASLQAAYDRAASVDELAPLWQRRNEVLRGMIAQLQAPEAGVAGVTRI
ncbi:MAG: hypothetical protein GXC76_03245 [Rhodanobacteraceae bacterium]|jgi:hypothetical protein|nr:hypothetical protein [Rhodanobacteraceae bacterium]